MFGVVCPDTARYVAAGLIAGSVFAAPASAEFETPPTARASELLGAKASGANYRVDDTVSSDGFLRVYQLQTDYGPFRVEGDALLRMRLRELAAIEALEAVENTATYQESFQTALKAPVDFVGDAIANPGEAVERTVTGVGRLFGRVAAGVRNVGKSPDNTAEALLGVSRARREIAVGLGVDPYTDFTPLANRLSQAAQVSAVGGLTVRGLFILIPGGAGLAVSTVSSATSVADLVRDRTPSELREINEQNLIRAAGRSGSIGLFLDNQAYTPTDQTLIADALLKLRDVKNVNAFLAPAAGVTERSQAVFMRERAVLLARHHQDVEPFREFVIAGGVPLCLSNDGRPIGVFPIDDFAWTQQAAALTAHIQADLAANGWAEVVALYTTGEATARSRDELQNLGWSVTGNISPSRE